MVTTHFLPTANFLAIFVSALAYFAFGYVWFSLLFAKVRNVELEKIGVKMSRPAGNKMAMKMLYTFAGNFLGAMAIAYVFHHLGVTTIDRGLKVGLIMGIGFTSSTLAIAYPWEDKSIKLFIIDAGHYVVGLLVCSLILSSWR